ncbi:MAG: polysaccharide deacetylase family protein [Chitinivibrionales bacterium]|nr:polysaccharide deacetylase family protein [Chitinivibrionales bacterium]MBD3394643.1 polysaccharide deacetylase family protein [Chitinivibrionales bacterium]
MSRKRKKKPHRCKNHPRVVARGKCARCGLWVCDHCALLRGGQFFCKDTCAPEEPAPQRAGRAAAPPVDAAPQHRAGFVLGAGATLGLAGLFGILFALRQSQEVERLRTRVAALERDRARALLLLRSQKERIAALSSVPAAGADTAAAAREIRRPTEPPVPAAANPVIGLPLNFNNGTRAKRLVALTFDGGSHANAADDILDTLRARAVAATMFLTGRFMKRYPELTKRIAASGHEVGNHTYSHPHLTSWATDKTHTTLPAMTRETLCAQLRSARETFLAITGAPMPAIWRAPYGEINDRLCRWSQECGYLHVGWRQGRRWRDNLDSNDWVPDEETPGYHSPQEVYDKVTGLARARPHGINGGILLMHLGTVRKDPNEQVHRILGTLIDDLRSLGYEFVTVSELLKESGIDISVLTNAGAGNRS